MISIKFKNIKRNSFINIGFIPQKKPRIKKINSTSSTCINKTLWVGNLYISYINYL